MVRPPPPLLDTGAADDLNTLRRGSLGMILICAAVVLYAWCLILFQPINLYHDGQPGPIVWGPVVLAIGLAVAFATQRRHLHLAAASVITGVAVTVFLVMWLFDDPAMAHLLAVVVSLTGVLFGIRVVIGAVVLSSASVVLVDGLRWGYPALSAEVLAPIAVICAVGVLSSVGVRNLYTALHWALDRATAAQRNEDEAREHRAELARVLKALTEAYQRLEYANYDLARAREAAEAASLNKQRFVAIVSHEMRTPLNILTALSEIMYFSPERYGATPLPPELRRDVRELYRSSRHLLRLMDDVLDLAQLEAGRMRVDFQATELNGVVTGVLDMIRPFVRERNIALRAEMPEDLPQVLIDRARIQQVLLNLVNNAQRYTDQGSITVSAVCDGDMVQVTVADTGIGIPPSEHEDMFKEFHQVEGLVVQGKSGCGLGLAICKRFVAMHGGRIWLESDGVPGHGSRFHFTLPRVDAPRVPTAKVQSAWLPQRLPTARHRVLLLVDDDPTVVRMLERGLEACRVVPVTDVRRIPAMVLDLHAEAVVVNLATRRYTEQRAELRKALAQVSVPVVRCSLVGHAQMAALLGAHGYLVKPVAREALEEVLARFDGRVRSVLVIDDDPQMARLLSRMLETLDKGYEVISASNGSAGLSVMRTRRPDLVLLDLVMPEMDGRAMLQAVRSDAALRDTPVVIITAQETTPEEQRMLGRRILLVRAAEGYTNAEVLSHLRGILRSDSAAGADGEVGQPSQDAQ